MKTFEPHTCECIIEFPQPYDERTAIQKQKCRSHDTAQDTINHNRSFSNRPSREMEIEKNKPEFQRR